MEVSFVGVHARHAKPSRLRNVALTTGLAAALTVPLMALPAAAHPGTSSTRARGADLCAQVAAKAGFRNDTLVTAVAIGLAESGCKRTARGKNGPTSGCPNGSTDRGLWQINSCYHARVSDRCAYNARCNADAAYRISARGTKFTPWVTYKNGRYHRYLGEARAAVKRLN